MKTDPPKEENKKPKLGDFNGDKSVYGKAYREWRRSQKLCTQCGGSLDKDVRGTRCGTCLLSLRKSRGFHPCIDAAKTLQLRCSYLEDMELKVANAKRSVAVQSSEFAVVVARWMNDLRVMKSTVADRASMGNARFSKCIHGKEPFTPREAMKIAKAIEILDEMMLRKKRPFFGERR